MNIHPVHTTAVQGFNVGYGLLQRNRIWSCVFLFKNKEVFFKLRDRVKWWEHGFDLVYFRKKKRIVKFSEFSLVWRLIYCISVHSTTAPVWLWIVYEKGWITDTIGENRFSLLRKVQIRFCCSDIFGSHEGYSCRQVVCDGASLLPQGSGKRVARGTQTPPQKQRAIIRIFRTFVCGGEKARRRVCRNPSPVVV